MWTSGQNVLSIHNQADGAPCSREPWVTVRPHVKSLNQQSHILLQHGAPPVTATEAWGGRAHSVASVCSSAGTLSSEESSSAAVTTETSSGCCHVSETHMTERWTKYSCFTEVKVEIPSWAKHFLDPSMYWTLKMKPVTLCSFNAGVNTCLQAVLRLLYIIK